jgi:hypothetical protein
VCFATIGRRIEPTFQGVPTGLLQRPQWSPRHVLRHGSCQLGHRPSIVVDLATGSSPPLCRPQFQRRLQLEIVFGVLCAGAGSIWSRLYVRRIHVSWTPRQGNVGALELVLRVGVDGVRSGIREQLVGKVVGQARRARLG